MKFLSKKIIAIISARTCFFISAVLLLTHQFVWANGIERLNGEWYSYQWKYGYTLDNGKGYATVTNSPNFETGQEIVRLTPVSRDSFVGENVYKDGKFYKVKVTLQSDGTLFFEGEKNVKWTMTRISSSELRSIKNDASVPSFVKSQIGKSYDVLRNELLKEGWVIFSRRDFKRYANDDSPITGSGRVGVCHQHGFDRRSYRFCWLEVLDLKRPSKIYQEIMSDANWSDEEYYLAEFVHPTDVKFKNQVRQIWFAICNGAYGYCTERPRGYLEIGADQLLSAGKAKKEFLSIALRHFSGD
jgi:hypothetical protein